MNKPLSMIVKETKTKLIGICNESGLPPVMLELILEGIHSEIRCLAEKQILNEEYAYIESLKDEDMNTKDIDNK
jgi:hypothetical protein